MSYSRYPNSVWYTYWSTNSGKTKATQIFSICGVADFTYEQIKADIDACVDKAAKAAGFARTEEQRTELKEYMQVFLQDADLEFQPSSADNKKCAGFSGSLKACTGEERKNLQDAINDYTRAYIKREGWGAKILRATFRDKKAD